MSGPTKTLAIDDEDGVLLLNELERSFRVYLGDSASGWSTVGDIYASLLTHIPTTDVRGKCATTMAFNRLRSALNSLSPACEITPRTKLKDLNLGTPKSLLRRLEKTLKLTTPICQSSALSIAAAIILTLGLPVLIAGMFFHLFWPALLIIVSSFILMTVDSGAYGSKTVGDWSREIAHRNYNLLTVEGADRRPTTVWKTLCEIVAEYSASTSSEIVLETRLLA